MNLLLDTHVLIWASEDPSRLGKKAQTCLLDPEYGLYVSAISTLEIARLAALEQLRLSSPVGAWCERARRALGATSIPVDDDVAVEAYSLPGVFHADPADRILVATARMQGLHVMTADQRILDYSAVRCRDARK